MDDFSSLNQRAASLDSKNSVLFLFNLSSGYNYSSVDVDITPPVQLGPRGETEVNIKGLNYKGLSGVGAVDGIGRFTYLRRHLNELGIATDGSFFSIFPSAPSFLLAVEEFKRVTGFNCSAADFDEVAFEPAADGTRSLKAHPASWRFYGEVNLGRPNRDDISELIPQNVKASLESYKGVFWSNAARLHADMIITHMPNDYARVNVGFLLDRINDPFVQFMTDQLRASGVDASFSVTPVDWVNIFRAKVVYKGALRSTDKPPMDWLDRVLEFELAPPTGLWTTGTLKLWFSTEIKGPPSQASSVLTALNLVGPELVSSSYAELLKVVTVGKTYRSVGNPRTAAELWLAVTGLVYRPANFDDLICTYNGPHRPKDQLPATVSSCHVIEFSRKLPATTGYSGPIKFFYKAN